MITPRSVRTKTSRTSHELINTGPVGPFLAKVIGHLDQTFMGGLKVQLLKTTVTSDNDSQEGEILTVQYASPFYGATPIYGAGGADNYSNTQKSYGFWAVPPDVGSKVLVIFVEGRRDFGFWFACVQDDFMNFMIPDGRAATSNTTPASTPEYYKGKKLPVGEYNKHLVDPQGQAQPTYYPRPVNDEYLKRMEEQGLIEDDVRGITSSSARREVPSNVYGMSTPGPLDKRPNSPKAPRGTVENDKLFFSSRLGGHSIVMDDGDEKIIRKGPAKNTPQEYVNLKVGQTGGDPSLPANELFRIRTRTGHQILMHNTEDLIYISNSRGTAWIELTSNGKIDIYAFDSISVHTNNDLNFTADRDINFTAYENMNFVVGKELRIDTGDSISMTSGNFYSLNAAESISQTAGEFIAGYAGASVTFVANTDFTALGAGVTIGSTGVVGIEGCSAVKISTDGDIHNKALGSIYNSTVGDVNFDVGQRYLLKTGSVVGINASGNVVLKGTNVDINGATPPAPSPATLPPAPDPVNPLEPKRALQTSRQPNHEPWFQHENLNPLAYTPERTRAGSQAINSFNIPTSDTFLPPSRQQPSGTVNTSYFPQYDGTTTEGGFQSFDGSPNVNAYRGTPGAPLPESQLVGVIDGFTKAETAAFLGAIGQRESNNAYDAVNSIGFSGKYQFGDGALEDLGYLKPGTTAKYSVKNALLISENWTGKDGITSRDAWLANTKVQEKAMLDYTNRNLKTLRRIGGIREGDDKATIAGMLAGSHLLGAGGMKKWRNGEGGADAYGTTGDEYFALGKAALQQASSSAGTSSNTNTGGGPI